MKREIGSNFWIEPNQDFSVANIDLANFGIQNASDWLLTSTGRSAEGILVRTIGKNIPDDEKIALVPPFTCNTVIDPFLEYGFQLKTYQLDDHLNTTGEMLRYALVETKAKVVLLHRYFGFNTLSDCTKVIREFSENGIIFIEDHTQSMYCGYAALPAQYHFGSLRKWLGVPDGGFAATMSGSLIVRPETEHREMIELKLEACRLKCDYMQWRTDNKDEFRRLYQHAEELMNQQKTPYSMARESIAIQAGTDINALKTKRRDNYKFVYEKLQANKSLSLLTPNVEDKDVPLYLVISAQNREELQAKLRDQNIFAPILWPRAPYLPKICKEAEYLYQHALCLPIDQRYDLDDMDRMVSCINL